MINAATHSHACTAVERYGFDDCIAPKPAKPNNARQHSNARKMMRQRCIKRGYKVIALVAVVKGLSDTIILGNGPVALFLEVKTGKAELNTAQEVEQAIMDKHHRFYRKVRFNKYPGKNRYDYSENDAALAELDRLNGVLLRALGMKDKPQQ